MGRLTGKVALIAGGATGIGAADSLVFAREGAQVAIGDTHEEAGQKLVTQIRSEGFEAYFVFLDTTSEASWKAAMESVILRFQKISVLVNNTGIPFRKDIEETSLSEWNHILEVNATTCFLGTKYAIKYMKDNNERCSIINHSSIYGQVGKADSFGYCAAEGAVTLLTKSAALMCGEKGYRIRVNSVHPGYIHTPFTEEEAVRSGITAAEYFRRKGEQHPIGYIGKPLDVAYGDVYLASDESLFTTGTELTMDGGWTAQ